MRPPVSGPGGPALALARLGAGECVLAADIGGTKTTTAWVSRTGEVGGAHTAPTRAEGGPDAVLEVATSGLRRARRDATAQGLTPVAVGVGTAGIVAGGRIAFATDAMPGWTGTEVVGGLSRELQLPTGVLNDVHAHALGEAICGAGRGAGSMLLVAVGTGIGGAIIAGGRVLMGAHGAAGHVGHVSVPEAAGIPCPCGRTGHLEGLASGAGIHARYEVRGEPVASTREVFARADAGERLAREVIAESAFATGRAIGGLINVLDPELVVVSGGIAETGEAWWDPLRRGAGASTLGLLARTPILPAALGAGAALIGAAHHGLSAPDSADHPPTREPEEI